MLKLWIKLLTSWRVNFGYRTIIHLTAINIKLNLLTVLNISVTYLCFILAACKPLNWTLSISTFYRNASVNLPSDNLEWQKWFVTLSNASKSLQLCSSSIHYDINLHNCTTRRNKWKIDSSENPWSWFPHFLQLFHLSRSGHELFCSTCAFITPGFVSD